MKHFTSLPLFRSVAALLALGIGSTLSSGALAASAEAARPLLTDDFVGVAMTHDSTLNDLVRRLPILSRAHEQSLGGLSAIQEMMLVHERKMRGEGLPKPFQELFSENYASIVTAIVDDRITMAYGRELLHLHRRLLDRAFSWQGHPVGDEACAEAVVLAVKEIREELAANAEPLSVVPECVRTPVVKGHLLWVEELLFAGCHGSVLSRGRQGDLRMAAQRLERFEGYYKRDHHLTRVERDNLHRRLIELNRELIDALRR